jgi:hypothetical protein
MSDRYKGAILSPTAPTVTPQSAGGIYTLSQQTQYQGQGVWPTAVNYPINNSLRFRASASAYLNRTPASAGNRQIFSFACWVKRGTLGTDYILSVRNGTGAGVGSFYIGFRLDQLQIVSADSAGNIEYLVRSAAVYRDPSAWYHIVCAVDTTQATSSNRVKIYVNGVQVTALDGASSYPTQNLNSAAINTTVPHYFGREDFEGGTAYHDYYLTEIYFIDGTALTPSSFGTTDAYGIWQPIPYTGAYGTNGYYLPFTDNSALTTSSNVGLGKDFSGNGNYWVTNNISITAGSTYDSMKDVPTNTNSNTANYAVLNPVNLGDSNSLSNANLSGTIGTTSGRPIYGSIAVTSGKWYWETIYTSNTANALCVGVNDAGLGQNINAFSTSPNIIYYDTYVYRNNSILVSGLAGFTTNDIMAVALDVDAGTIAFYKNNTLLTTQNLPTGNGNGWRPVWINGTSAGSQGYSANFGQQPFSYTPPTGFLPLNTYNLPTPTILAGNQYMDATIYTGTGSTQSIVNSGAMQPDFVWAKSRSTGSGHVLSDSVRGAGKSLASQSTDAEVTDAQQLVSFNSNGFTMGTTGDVNFSGRTYVGWQWRASNAAGVSNTQGTITSTVSANTTAGFSIATFTSPSSGTASFGHGLGVTPSFVIVKSRANGNWICQHTSTGAQYLLLNGTGAATTDSIVWNSAFTSTVVNIGTGFAGTVNYVAYCFSAVAGYSAFGSYTGNGSTDGPFVYTGFRPRFLMMKRFSAGTANWYIFDSSRSTYNAIDVGIYPNLANAETALGASTYDFLSNGFKLRQTNADFNESGIGYIYAAFAENPFKISRAR